jgi:hypothetical protein
MGQLDMDMLASYCDSATAAQMVLLNFDLEGGQPF